MEVKYSSTLYTLSSVECALAIRSKMHQLRCCDQESLICTSSLHKFLCISTSWPIQSLTVAPWPMHSPLLKPLPLVKCTSMQFSAIQLLRLNAILNEIIVQYLCNTQVSAILNEILGLHGFQVSSSASNRRPLQLYTLLYRYIIYWILVWKLKN